MRDSTHRIAFIPAILGSLLWASASALLIEDSFHSGKWTVTAALQPVLTASAVASAVWVHWSLSERRPLRAVGFALLAVLASIACLWGTMGKLAEAQDNRTGDALRANRTLHLKSEELAAARKGAADECRKMGPRCSQWQIRVDQLTREASSLQIVSEDPRADTLGRVAGLLGYDADRMKQVAVAVTPLLLPTVLELGSILFFICAFPGSTTGRNGVQLTETHAVGRRPWSQSEALAQFREMRKVGAQQFLADQWGVDKSTVSRWLAAWETEGLIRRRRDGRRKSVALLGRTLLPRT